MARQPALITPSVLRWARETAHLDVPFVAEKLKRTKEEIQNWESGKSSPTFAQAQKVAHLYRRPLAVFYLPEPPPKEKPLPDFRQMPGNDSPEYSYELELRLRQLQVRQEWLREYFIENDFDKLDFIGSISAKVKPEKSAEIIRRRIGISLATQAEWNSPREALGKWVGAIEELGVFVCCQGGIPLQEMRGMALTDEYASFIFLNSNDSYAGRVFTLFHELAHLFLNEPGISNLENLTTRSTKPTANVERYCNQVASFVIMPPKPFLDQWKKCDQDDQVEDQIKKIANFFSVSEETVARRLLDLSKITQDQYLVFRNYYVRRWEEWREQQKKRKGGPKHEVLRALENGKAFSKIVLTAYSANNLSGRDASGLLNTKLNHFGKLAKQVGITWIE